MKSKTTIANIETVKRGWGIEKWIENSDEYCGKVLLIPAGKKGSMHFHIKKTETMMLVSGIIELSMIDPETGKRFSVMLDQKFDSIKIRPGHAHQIISHKDAELVEFSTKHYESDSYRIKKGD